MHLFLIGDMAKYRGNARKLLHELVDIMSAGGRIKASPTKESSRNDQDEASVNDEGVQDVASLNDNDEEDKISVNAEDDKDEASVNESKKYFTPTMHDIYVYVMGPSNSIAHHMASIYEGEKNNYEFVMKSDR